MFMLICLFDLIFYVPVNSFQLCQGGSFWVEPVLSKDKCVFCGSFVFLFCLVFAMSLDASVYMCFVLTCLERADLLALVCGV